MKTVSLGSQFDNCNEMNKETSGFCNQCYYGYVGDGANVGGNSFLKCIDLGYAEPATFTGTMYQAWAKTASLTGAE